MATAEMKKVAVEVRDIVFQNRLQTFSIVNISHTDIDKFFTDAYKEAVNRLEPIIDNRSIIVVGACFVGEFNKKTLTTDGEENLETQTQYTQTSTVIIDFETVLSDFFNKSVIIPIKNKIEDGELRGSNFSLSRILELNIQISSFEPLAGSSYIKTPEALQHKHGIVNVQNVNDELCFHYAVLSAIYTPTEQAHRVSNYAQMISDQVLNFTGIKFPVQLRDITKFEKLNPTISIHVYMYDEKANTVQPIRLTKEVKKDHVHLLLLTEQSEGCEFERSYDIDGNITSKMHYCWIKNLSALVGKQISANCRKKILCDRCLNHFITQTALDEHNIQCVMRNECTIEMPSELNNKIRFEKVQNQLVVPFIIYADIESLLKPPTQQIYQSNKTKAIQEHEAYSVGYYFKHFYDQSQSFYRSFRGERCIDWFVNEMKKIAERIADVLNQPKEMETSLENEVHFAESRQCHICGKMYVIGDNIVRDHSHITGAYRGSAHNECNLKYQESRCIPVIFHNLSHYDAHFIVKKLAMNVDGPISVIPLNDELYISFTKVFPNNTRKFEKFVKLKFIDSFRFMPSSLDYLASILPSDKKSITHSYLRGEKKYNDLQIKLLEHKGVFCYDYVDCMRRLDETRLPHKSKFYSSLNECHITAKDYNHAKNVWIEFDIQTLGDYSDLYMQTDILLLADIFENFRITCQNIYGLDPAHYYTAPGLSFDAMLKYTGVEIELLTDIDMLLFIENGIRGGVSQCSKRYASANNKYTNTSQLSVDPNFLIYLDANNLYGHSMSQYLPLNSFRWCTKEFNENTIMQLDDESCDGYIFEVDLEYPVNLHDVHKDYPMCPEKRSIPGSLSNNKKLLLTLFDKEQYVIHYRMLKLALQQGLRLKKIHRVLEFQQKAWIKPYIDLNTALRIDANNEFEKNFFKLMINTIFGKTMENERSRVDIKLKTKWEGRYGARKLIAQPNFKKWTAFGDNFVAIHMSRTKILMNKPISVGMTILDLSKELMYSFYYNFLKQKYGNNLEMMYTDTDSFMLNVKTNCFYTDMLPDIEMRYDTSDFSVDNEFGIPQRNKKIPGLFKDELNGRIFTEFVGLRSKMYAFRSIDSKDCKKLNRWQMSVFIETKKAKGVKRSVLDRTITFDDYADCVRENSVLMCRQNTFRSKQHSVFTVSQIKVGLSPFDDKRFVLPNNIDTLPWGHCDIPAYARQQK